MPKAPLSKSYMPRRGDIAWVNLDPTAGHEQAHQRPVLVLSPDAFNKKIGLALVAPITSRGRGHGFEVVLAGTKTMGAVLCQQVRTIDYQTRGVKFLEQAPPAIVADVLAKVRVLVS
jgi:mRNA interferase MazF